MLEWCLLRETLRDEPSWKTGSACGLEPRLDAEGAVACTIRRIDRRRSLEKFGGPVKIGHGRVVENPRPDQL